MQTHISTRGAELTDDLKARIEGVANDLADRAPGLELAKFVVEERETTKAIGLVLSWGEQQDTVVRHAEATDWDRAFLDLVRRLERALEEVSSESP
jgi:ribosome-associated translation inhibitor RaiA